MDAVLRGSTGIVLEAKKIPFGNRQGSSIFVPVASLLVIGIPPADLPPGIPSGECASTPISLIQTPTATPSGWPVIWQAVRSIRSFAILSNCEQARSTDARTVSSCTPALPDSPRSHRRSWIFSLDGERHLSSRQGSEQLLRWLKRWPGSEMGATSVMQPGLASGRSSTTMRLPDCCTPLGSSGSGTPSTWPSSSRLGRSCRKSDSREPARTCRYRVG